MLLGTLEAPVAFAISESGLVACLDRGGARLRFAGDERVFDPPAGALAFQDDVLTVLDVDRVVTIGRGRGVLSVTPVRAVATAVAVTMSGGLLVGYGGSDHGIVVERFGEHPLELRSPPGFAVRALAVDTGGFWVGGDRRLIGYRPALGNVTLRADLPLDAAARSMAVGPDGALYVLLADGRRLVRVKDGHAEDAGTSDEELAGIARHASRLVGCGASATVDLSAFVLPPPEKGPEFVVPACE